MLAKEGSKEEKGRSPPSVPAKRGLASKSLRASALDPAVLAEFGALGSCFLGFRV